MGPFLTGDSNQNTNQQFKEDEIAYIRRWDKELNDYISNPYPKIGGRLRLAHEDNEVLSIETESLLTKSTMKFNENKPAVVISLPPASIQDRIHTIKKVIISDIHGNYEALLSVNEDIQKAQVDKIICLGDFIGYGPQPEEVAQFLIENEIPCVLGNHENAIINPDTLVNFSTDAMLSIEITRDLISD